jgi:hypothetical protein
MMIASVVSIPLVVLFRPENLVTVLWLSGTYVGYHVVGIMVRRFVSNRIPVFIALMFTVSFLGNVIKDTVLYVESIKDTGADSAQAIRLVDEYGPANELKLVVVGSRMTVLWDPTDEQTLLLPTGTIRDIVIDGNRSP